MVDEAFLTFDDVLIAPAYSDIETRSEIDTSIEFLGQRLEIPIISANMDFVTGATMMNAMYGAGAMGILHRFHESPQAYDAELFLLNKGMPFYMSIGIKDIKDSYDLIKAVAGDTDFNLYGVCIDVAHGHHKKVGDLIELIKGSTDERISGLRVIAGNVATLDGATFLAEHGADALKVGIGAGSVCTTRTVAGVGIPQWSAVLECVQVKREYPNIAVIADGGIRSSGDIAKALAVGADAVMVGNMLAGTDEAPGEVFEDPQWGSDRKFKRYRGQASFGSNGEKYTKEGIEGVVPYKGPVAPIVAQIQAGLRSAMSYVGARNMNEFHEKAKFVQVSSHTLVESSTRVQSYE